MKLKYHGEYQCNRCDDPNKPSIQSKADPSKQRKKPGTIGRNCKGKMVVKVFELYGDAEGTKLIETIATISDSLPSVHSQCHDISFKLGNIVYHIELFCMYIRVIFLMLVIPQYFVILIQQ